MSLQWSELLARCKKLTSGRLQRIEDVAQALEYAQGDEAAEGGEGAEITKPED